MSLELKLNRRQALAGAGSLVGLAALSAPALAASPTVLRVGHIPRVVSDSVFLLAQANGHLAEEGIELEFTGFAGGSKIITPLSTGQIDIGAGAPSAGLFNALGRDIELRIVADKGSSPAGFSYTTLIVRSDLMESGEVSSFKDMKGRTVALSGPAATPAAMLNRAMMQDGLSYADVEVTYLGYGQMAAAMSNGAIDGAIMVEPIGTKVIASGTGTRLWNDDVYPYQQIAALMFSESFANERPEVAQSFMRAYVRGARDYNDALQGGAFSGEKGKTLLNMLVDYTSADLEILNAMIPTGINPDGGVYVDSLRADYDFYNEYGFIENAEVGVEGAIDTSFADAAVKELGPYVPNPS